MIGGRVSSSNSWMSGLQVIWNSVGGCLERMVAMVRSRYSCLLMLQFGIYTFWLVWCIYISGYYVHILMTCSCVNGLFGLTVCSCGWKTMCSFWLGNYVHILMTCIGWHDMYCCWDCIWFCLVLLDFILFECIVMLYDGYMMVIVDEYSV